MFDSVWIVVSVVTVVSRLSVVVSVWLLVQAERKKMVAKNRMIVRMGKNFSRKGNSSLEKMKKKEAF